MKRNPQTAFKSQDFPKQEHAYGGHLLKKAKARQKPRPLSTKLPLHLILKSSQAVGKQSLLAPCNAKRIRALLDGFAKKYGIKIVEYSNNGNQLHVLVKLSNRFAYAPFIRALTGAIALHVSGSSKLKALKKKFWDYRPFTRIVVGFRGYLVAKDYVTLNRLESAGVIPYMKRRLRDIDRGSMREMG